MAERRRTLSSDSPNRSEPSALQSQGAPAPLGATVMEGGVNFSLSSRDVTHLEPLLFVFNHTAEGDERGPTLSSQGS